MEDQISRTIEDSIKGVKDSWSKDLAEIRLLLQELVGNLATSKPTPVEFQRFCGDNPELWISQAERYFEFYAIAENHKLSLASSYLDGAALSWYRWLLQNKQLADWDHFTAKVLIRFHERHLESPESRLASLWQVPFVTEYSSRFESVSSSFGEPDVLEQSEYKSKTDAHNMFDEMLNSCCPTVFTETQSDAPVEMPDEEAKGTVSSEVQLFDGRPQRDLSESLEHLSEPSSDEDRNHLLARLARNIYPQCRPGLGQRLEEMCIMSAYCYVQLISKGIFARFSTLGHAAVRLTWRQFCHNQFELNFPFDPGSNLFTIFLGAIRNCEYWDASGSLNLAKFLKLNMWNSCTAPLKLHIRETNNVRKYTLLEVSADVFLAVPLNMLPGLAGGLGRRMNSLVPSRNLGDFLQQFCLYDPSDVLHYVHGSSAQPPGEQYILSLMSQLKTPRETEIADKLWQKMNMVAPRYDDEVAAELLRAVLFNNKVHMLDMGYFSYLNVVMESSLSQILIFAANKGAYYVTRTTMTTHCNRVDLLDWLLNVETETYGLAEVMPLLAIRAREREPCRKQMIERIVSEMLKETSFVQASTLLPHCYWSARTLRTRF